MKYRSLLVAAILLAPIPVRADPPKDIAEDVKYARAGMCNGGHAIYVGTNQNTVRTGTIATADAWNQELLIPFGSLVNLTCDADAVFCWVSDDSATTSTTGYVADASSTSGAVEGVGGCFKVEGSSYRDNVGFRSPDSPKGILSQRTKSCSSTTSAVINRKVAGHPCDSDADCIYGAASVSCVSSPPRGLYLRHVASAETNCWICMDE